MEAAQKHAGDNQVEDMDKLDIKLNLDKLYEARSSELN